jgi:hypothetical protein
MGFVSRKIGGRMDKLHESILQAGDYVNSHYGVTYYLNPIDGCIEPWLETGAGVPKAAYHNIWAKILTAPADAIPESVVKVLLELEDTLIYDCKNNFQRTKWDGSNFIGVWKRKPDYEFEYQIGVACYWSPEDWFDVFDIKKMRRKWQSGMTPDQIIAEENLGSADQGMVDREEAIEWLEEMIAKWKEEEEEERNS